MDYQRQFALPGSVGAYGLLVLPDKKMNILILQ